MVDKKYLLDNAQSFAPYGKTVSKKQIKVDKKGRVIVTISKKKYKFDSEAMVVL